MSHVCVTAGNVKENQWRELEHDETKRDDCGRLVTITDTLFHVYLKVHGVKY